MALMSKSVEIEPSSFVEAMQQQIWVDAIIEEYNYIIKNIILEVVPRTVDKEVVRS